MKFEETISSIEDLISGLGKYYDPIQRIWYRGQSCKDWNLVPSLARIADSTKRVAAESIYIKTFKQNALPYSPHWPSSEWDWLFLMQHYRAPTRLLDWSESPLVALYFAALPGTSTTKCDGALWCLSPMELNRRASLDTNTEADLPFFDIDKYLENYLPSTIAQEKMTQLEPVAAVAQRQFPRLFAQLGVFTITHRDKQEISDGEYLGKFVIPIESKEQILRQLALLGITTLTIFPELESVGRLTRETRV